MIVPRDTANVPVIDEGLPESVNDDDPDTDIPAGVAPEYECPETRESEYVGNARDTDVPTVKSYEHDPLQSPGAASVVVVVPSGSVVVVVAWSWEPLDVHQPQCRTDPWYWLGAVLVLWYTVDCPPGGLVLVDLLAGCRPDPGS